MNIRKITQVMIVILCVLLFFIILSLMTNNNKENNNVEIIDEENEIHKNISEVNDYKNEIYFMNIFNLENYLKEDDVLELEKYLSQALTEYGSTKTMFDTTNIKYENDTLSFIITSDDNNEQYQIDVRETESTITRLK